ncbi:polysaccharide deacetylase family protein [Capillimicrobium parvum]|uniref:Peptidoglycan deacetylase n=1 Tax=Capillimicrobium parvum TaxID=2884022 RepID=A0A9E7C289_9ACTN|nr:polysaccharide deacetylase [Capillimicrobium parvum]UGS38310.1 Peptidoglycan deacetylase [Capillimicrobium parvum]
MSDRKFSICLTFDPDATSIWVGTFASNNPSMISRGEYDVAVGVPRVLDLLERNDIKATFFIPGHVACAYPDVVKEIDAAGHEIGHHGMFHENPADLDRAGEKEVLEMGFAALDKAAGVRPKGFRSAAWDLSPNSIELLLEFGLLYDTSCMANDFESYYLRTGDTWGPKELYQFGEVSELVEMPVTWLLDDFIVFEHIWGSQEGLRRPADIEELWRGEFDYGYANSPGGLIVLTMHPQVIGRGSRITMLQRLIDHFKAHEGVVFERMSDAAERWKAENPVAKWKAENPIYTGVNAITVIPTTP